MNIQSVKQYIANNKVKVAIYAAIVLITIVLAIPLLVWASKSVPVGVTVEEPATVIVAEGMRTEYLESETIAPEDFSLELEDGRVIAGADCELEFDNTSAGLKAVTASWQEGSTIYKGTFPEPVKVLGVRHIAVELAENIPSVWIDAEGKPVFSGNTLPYTVLANVTEETDAFAHPEDNPEWKDTIVLSPTQYTITSSVVPGGYAFEVACGEAKTAFAVVRTGSTFQAYNMQSAMHYISFQNTTGGAETLTLFVAQAERNNSDGNNEGTQAKGTYVYTDAAGNVSTYQFAFYLNGWESNFLSTNLNNWAIQDSVDNDNWGGDMRVAVGNVIFRGAYNDWHFAVLDNRA